MNLLEKMFELVSNNDFSDIKNLIEKHPKLIEEADNAGIVPAFVAAKEGHFELVKYMMEYTRVSMNIVDSSNQSILHYAAMSNNVDCFKYLVERISMDPYLVNRNMESPLDIAHKYHSDQIIIYYKEVLGITKDNIYYNPIIAGTYPDPSIIRVGEDYYMVNSSFFLFPCIPIQHSKDLVHWRTIGHGITDASFIDLTEIGNGRGFWAPDISYSKGKFYITATLRLNDDDPIIRKQMIVSSSTPEGPYSKPIYVDVDGIDPSLFTDDDGRRYMLLNRGARIFEISHEGDKVLSEPMMLWYGDNKRAPEAPHLLKKDGYYYCFVSEGGTGVNHQISVARSKTLMGPYESCPYNPILKQNNPLHPIQRSGHGKLVETQHGEWYIVYLCGRMVAEKYSILGRETGLDKVVWTKDGWPMINNNKGPSGFNLLPNLTPDKGEKALAIDGLNDDDDWVFVRAKDERYIRKDLESNTFYMIAGKYDLSSFNARNVMLKRQTIFQFDCSVEIILDCSKDHVEAGMTCYYDTDTYLKYYISKEGKSYFLNVKEKIGDIETLSLNASIDFTKHLTIKITTDYLKRSFYYMNNEGKWTCIGTLENVYYLCDEGISLAKRFTGAMIGLYTYDPESDNNIEIGYRNFHIRRLI